MSLPMISREDYLDTIYGIKIDDRVNHNYFHMAQEFKKQNLEFLIFDLESLSEVIQKNPITWLILFTTSIDEVKVFDRKLKQSLRPMVAQERLGVFQFTSFSAENGNELQGLKTNFYQLISLPLKTSEAVQIVNDHIEKIYRTLDSKTFKEFLKSN